MHQFNIAGPGSLVGCMSAWYADSHGFDPWVRQHSFMEIGHEIISTAILSLPLMAGCGSLIECASAWYADSHRFDPHIQHYTFVEYSL